MVRETRTIIFTAAVVALLSTYAVIRWYSTKSATVLSNHVASAMATEGASNVDLGAAYRGQIVEANFSITNNHLIPIHIREALPSCSCVTVTQPSEIAPGETKYLIASMDTLRRPSDTWFSVRVRTDEDVNSTHTYVARVRVEDRIVASPFYVEFGQVHKYSGRPIDVRFEMPGGQLPVIVRVDSTLQSIRPLIRNSIVQFSISEDASIGDQSGELKIVFDSEYCPMVRIPVHADVLSDLDTSPGDLLSFGTMSRQSGAQHRKVIVRSARPSVTIDHVDVSIFPVSAQSCETNIRDYVTVSATEEVAGAQWIVEVTVLPSYPKDRILFDLFIDAGPRLGKKRQIKVIGSFQD